MHFLGGSRFKKQQVTNCIFQDFYRSLQVFDLSTLWSRYINQKVFLLHIWFESRSWRGVLDATLCHKVCRWLAAVWWFSSCTPVSSTNIIDRHDEILLKVVLNTTTLLPQPPYSTFVSLVMALSHIMILAILSASCEKNQGDLTQPLYKGNYNLIFEKWK
jgi:hypothetical protein